MDYRSRRGVFIERFEPTGEAAHVIPADVHRSLKIRSAELDVPMAEFLRKLIVETLADSSALNDLAERYRQPLD